MNIELILIIAIVAIAGLWVIRKYIRGSKAKSCSCGCSSGCGGVSSCNPSKKQ